ncbi:MAG: hypothetical protein NTX86_03840 [Candidatus Dependentiae bacterium]|nr:hypothetical protein [Candidatus Dependentiae bacterium]
METRSRTIDLPAGACVREKNIIGGSIFNVQYIPSKSWWFEVTTGLEKEHTRAKGTFEANKSRFGFDDIVLAGGHRFFITDDWQFVLYGLAGFPTRYKVTPEEVYTTLVGTRFFSAGVGGELSYSFINSMETMLIGTLQARFLHFFSRQWFPVLPCDAKIQPGNVTDALLSLKYRHKKNIVELIYNPTFFTNQAFLLKDSTVEVPAFVRHSVSISFAHVFVPSSQAKTMVVVEVGLNPGWSKFFKTRLFAYWADFGLVF